jgi:serine/threonine protein phosphatase PrpC
MRFLPANAQHIGARHSQQDSFGFGDPENREFVAHGGFLAVVCDGMGGMEFGDAASRAATRAFLDAYQVKTADESIPVALERSVRTANDAVCTLSSSYGLSEGMGTTLVAAVFHDSSMYYISVGDSGLFLLRGGILQMINRPHVFANLLDAAVARGTLSREDADHHPERESLTSFVGTESLKEIDANVDPIPLAPGDAVMLASDGLFKTLSNSEMLACLNGNLLAWPDALVEKTIGKKREHQDNVTVLSITVQLDGTPTGIPFIAPVDLPKPPAPPPPPAAPPPAAAPLPPIALVSPSVPMAAPAAMSMAAVPSPSRSRASVSLLIAILIVAAAGAAWYFTHHRKPMLGSGSSDPGSTVSAPPRSTPIEIKVDPDAPIEPSHPLSAGPAQKGAAQ